VTAGKLAATVGALILGLTGAVAGLGGLAQTSPTFTALDDGAPAAELSAEQASNARVIVAVGQERRVPTRGLLVALMTAAQESGLRNLDYGDRDSLGLFQQRPSMGWGTPAQVRDPAYAAAAFYGGPASPTGNRGLLSVPGWESMPLTAAAQAVQRSAFPTAYAKWEAPARVWLADILERPTALDCGRAGSSPVLASGAAQVAITAAAQWLGTPYAWGGGSLTGPSEGFGMGAGTVGVDCSGLTRYAWAQAGILLPRTSRKQWYAPGTRITSLDALQPGDLVFFATNTANPATIHHVAIALGGDAMLEAPQTGDVVKVLSGISTNSFWAPRFIGGLRLTS
jgi:cell wall-associated NlpC family hydrolase